MDQVTFRMMVQQSTEPVFPWMLLKKLSTTHRHSVGDEASKQSDIWPIENVWAIVKAKIDKTETTSLAHLKRKIVSVWREIDADKDLCRRMMASIPARLAAVVRKQGSKITKEDY